jgi:hypothetical protein
MRYDIHKLLLPDLGPSAHVTLTIACDEIDGFPVVRDGVLYRPERARVTLRSHDGERALRTVEIGTRAIRIEEMLAAQAAMMRADARRRCDEFDGLPIVRDGVLHRRPVGRIALCDECACPGCGCRPGDGRTEGCDDADGCGFLRRQYD